MPFREKRAPRPVFDWTVVPCTGPEGAEAEAQRRQQGEQSDAVWIFLQVDKQWIARRTPADPDRFEPPADWRSHRPLCKRAVDFILESPITG